MTQTHTQTQDIYTLSADPGKAMQEMMDTIDSLRGIYIRETDALETADTVTFLNLQEEKLNVARRYQFGIAQMIDRKDEMQGVNPTLKLRLHDMQAEFSNLARKNMDALQRMQRCTERLGDIIRGAAKDAVKKHNTFSYGATGTIKDTQKRSVSMGLSETA